MSFQGIRILIGFALVTALLQSGAPAAQAGDATAFQKILKERSDALVTVKLMLDLKGGFVGPSGQKVEQEATAVIIDSSGLVLASSTELGGMPPALQRMMSQMGAEMSITPSDIKVLIGDDTEGLEAEIIARDSELDLAWVKIKEPGEKTFTALDLSKSTDPKLGQRLIAVRRMEKYFDRTPVVQQVRVAGITTKPRRMFLPSEGIGEGFCVPVYTTDGVLVGLTALQIPDLDLSAGNPMAAASQMSNLQSMAGGFILPAVEIVKATERALAQAAAETKEPGPTGQNTDSKEIAEDK